MPKEMEILDKLTDVLLLINGALMIYMGIHFNGKLKSAKPEDAPKLQKTRRFMFVFGIPLLTLEMIFCWRRFS